MPILRGQDGQPGDLEAKPNQVLTKDGTQLIFDQGSLAYCVVDGDSTIYFASKSDDNSERLAFAVQSNLEMGAPPTRFYGLSNTFASGKMTSETLSKA